MQKIHGSLTVTKGLRLQSPGGSTPAAGLVALSDAQGNIHWGHLAILPLVLGYTYPVAGTIVIHLNKVYYSVVNNAVGSAFEDPLKWAEITGGEGTPLTQAQIDALNAANNPSASNPFATLTDVQNLSLKGTETVANILIKSALVKNNLWISSTVGVDSLGAAVVVGDGLVSTGTGWKGIGQIRGPIGLPGPAGVEGPVGPVGVGVSLKGSATIENILIRDATTVGKMWIATNNGVDGAGAPVLMGDGIVSNGTTWLNIGPFRGPVGPSAYSGTYLIKGGVFWLTGYTYLVVADSYVINGEHYSAAAKVVTLTPSNEFLDRRDVFVVDIYGNIFVEEGISSNPPIKPSVNDTLLLELSDVTIVRNTTVSPLIGSAKIFDEHLGIGGGEFDTTVLTNNGATIDLDYTVDKYSGTKAIRVINGRNEIISFVPSAAITFSTGFSGFTMRAKSLSATYKANVTVRLLKGGVKVARALLIEDFGFNYSNTTDWQLLTMSLSDFAPFAVDFDELVIVFEDPTYSGKTDILIDSLEYQFGVFVPSPESILEYTSQLINNGDGSSPFLTIIDLPGALSLNLQQICNEGYTTTTNLITQAQTSTGTRLGGDLVVSLGDYDGTGNGTKLVISDVTGTATVSGDFGVQNIASSFRAVFGTDLLTTHRAIEIPNKAGVMALVSDIPTNLLYMDLLTAQAAEGVKTFIDSPVLRSNLLFNSGANNITITPGVYVNQVITLPPTSGTLALLSDVGTFIFDQPTPAGTWIVNHGKNKYPSVMVVNSAKETIEAKVAYVDANNIVITVFPIVAGYAYIN